ncbi:hypothetical protein MNEG_1879 [Monoraphidium neglectum]|uniref:Uncharacterized protein n=1 Tax=Monoraphidium neglectum TaxID=145388 RepID=A0A0D2NNN6_9CHLO|nr:hypothetical protein MNEG_1879 [Monoraphidium neglectum]KIZ06086.1 hypothetical protein MNEG_1879 [Monoraphidium neglectum]|eukprot:XP_013905105.1 hypothetical protein MNEG_1879 [Monoraphidium neglectum]
MEAKYSSKKRRYTFKLLKRQQDVGRLDTTTAAQVDQQPPSPCPGQPATAPEAPEASAAAATPESSPEPELAQPDEAEATSGAPVAESAAAAKKKKKKNKKKKKAQSSGEGDANAAAAGEDGDEDERFEDALSDTTGGDDTSDQHPNGKAAEVRRQKHEQPREHECQQQGEQLDEQQQDEQRQEQQQEQRQKAEQQEQEAEPQRHASALARSPSGPDGLFDPAAWESYLAGPKAAGVAAALADDTSAAAASASAPPARGPLLRAGLAKHAVKGEDKWVQAMRNTWQPEGWPAGADFSAFGIFDGEHPSIAAA